MCVHIITHIHTIVIYNILYAYFNIGFFLKYADIIPQLSLEFRKISKLSARRREDIDEFGNLGCVYRHVTALNI